MWGNCSSTRLPLVGQTVMPQKHYCLSKALQNHSIHTRKSTYNGSPIVVSTQYDRKQENIQTLKKLYPSNNDGCCLDMLRCCSLSSEFTPTNASAARRENSIRINCWRPWRRALHQTSSTNSL